MADTSSKQHLFARVLARVHAVCAAELGASADLSRVVVEPPKDPTHGDMATNAAMVLAKEAKVKPRDLAEKIAGMSDTNAVALVWWVTGFWEGTRTAQQRS